MSVVTPRSQCPECRQPIAWYDNIPILSYLFLGGQCRHCASEISFEYPMVELLSGVLFVLVYITWSGEFEHFFTANSDPTKGVSTLFLGKLAYLWGELGLRLIIISALTVISFIDLKFRIIPNELTISGIVLGPIIALIHPDHFHYFLAIPEEPIFGSAPLNGLTGSIIGILVGGGIIYGLKIFGEVVFQKPSMGWGDVKMMAGLGGLFGWKSVILILFLASIFGTVIGLVNLWITREHYIPFGPFLSAGAAVMVLRGHDLLVYIHETYQVAFPF